MADNHSHSFFGQSTGVIINSKATELDWYLRCIKRKPDGSWEKPSTGEGKVIKLSLDETVMILHVLNKLQDKWSTYHQYKETKTQISFAWNDENKEQLWLNIGSYSKMFNFAQVQIFRDLVRHFYHEKIEYATIPTAQQQKEEDAKTMENALQQDIKEHQKKQETQQDKPKDLLVQVIEKTGLTVPGIKNMIKEKQDEFKGLISEEGALRFIAIDLGVIDSIPIEKNNTPQETLEHKTEISALMKAETEKAMLLQCKNLQGELIEMWVPKSTVYNEYEFKKDSIGEFVIINWILRKNNIIEEKKE